MEGFHTGRGVCDERQRIEQSEVHSGSTRKGVVQVCVREEGAGEGKGCHTRRGTRGGLCLCECSWVYIWCFVMLGGGFSYW